MELETLLKELCEINGISGDESAVREYIIGKIDGFCEYRTDPLGSIIAFRKGRKAAPNKVMISAHMDEVGMIVTYIHDDGTLCVSSVGGIEPEAAAGIQVRVNGITGVTGTRPVHHLSADERKKPLLFDGLPVDIGADSREEAEKYVSLGDSVTFADGYRVSRGGFVTSKAIDDRAGCAILIKMICEGIPEYDFTAAFVVQEEIGLRGARAAAYTIDPDLALVLESTTAADTPLAQGEKKCCICGKGAVVSYMDRSTCYDREIYKLCFDTAAENDIPCQTKTMVAGGNDSGAIHISRGGVRTAAISVPCRYLHSPSCTASLSDIEACARLAALMTDKLAVLGR